MAGRAGLAALALLAAASPAAAEELIWGLQVEQAELRVQNGEDVLAWDLDAFIGGDELRLTLRSEAEYGLDEDAFESAETQLRLQTPVSDFWDAVVGVRYDTPAGGPERAWAVIGLHGLAPQWLEIDADLFLSEHPVFRFEAEYEALITNRLILVPSVEIDLPLADDSRRGQGAFAPTVEIGARLGYDLVDRALSPYLGVHYELRLGETGDRARAAGGRRDELFAVAGIRMMF
ncbi:MAG: copper resistance protein B [Pikeienuella sp.]|uniref:copper resistance protein B n=1 Tax=Pikeienuella sp. TaxID=2831957 RepID=UPI0039188491